jgi:protein O-GlcNAc transferase
MVWLAAILSPVYAQQPSAEDVYRQHLLAATGEAAHGDVSAAMADTRAALGLNENGAAAWYQLGSLLGQTGDFSGAEAALRHAIELQPNLAKAHYSLALALVGNPQEKLDWDGAIAECRAALKSQPEYAEALNLLGAGLNATGQPEAAVAVLQRALQLSPTLAPARFNLALALETGEHLDEAARAYQAAIALPGSYPEANSGYAKLLLRMGKTEAAEQQARIALRLNPDLTDAHYTLARILEALHRKSEAAVEFAQAKELGERQPHGIEAAQMSNAGLQAAARGNLTEAITLLRKAIGLKPDYGVPHYNLGLVLADSGDTAGALQELTKAISLLPGQPKPWFDLGRVQERAGNKQAALEDIRWAAYLSPSNAAIDAKLASLETSPGPQAAVPNRASAASRPSVGADADAAAVHLAFAAQLSKVGDSLGAVGELLRSLALEPANVEARRALAAAYEHLGENDRAMLEDYKVLLSAPQDAVALISLGEILLERGNAEEACRYLRQALASRPDSADARAALDRAEKLVAPH